MELLTSPSDLKVALQAIVTPETALGFDVGSVLDPFNGDVPRRKFMEQSGRTYEEVRVIMNDLPTVRDFFVGKCDAHCFATQLLQQLGINRDPEWVLARMLEGHGPEDRATYRVAQAFSDQAACMFVLSNNNTLHTEFIRAQRGYLLEPFEQKYQWFSQEIGLWKPDDECLEFVEQRLPSDCSKIVFVDDRQDNVKAMLGRGWEAVLYSNNA